MMKDTVENEKRPLENITDLIEGLSDESPIEIEISVTADNKVVLFHDKKFTREISWFEFDLSNGKLDFILEDGAVRDVIGMPLAPRISKYMQNAHQILMVLMNDETGEAEKGEYVPLIIHKH